VCNHTNSVVLSLTVLMLTLDFGFGLQIPAFTIVKNPGHAFSKKFKPILVITKDLAYGIGFVMLMNSSVVLVCHLCFVTQVVFD